MSKTILANVDGWTPLIDHLSRKYGLVRSAVFGRIWRYCQGEKKACTASLETIAIDLGLDKSTVMRHAKILCDDGFLEDLTPDARYVPHIYADTGKAGIVISVSAKEIENASVAENNTPEPTVAQCNTLAQSVALCNGSVAENQLKKEVRENKLRDTSRGGTPDILPLREERSGKDIALAHRESTARALARGIEGYANDPTGIDLNGYPADVVDIIRYTCKEWGLRPPYRKGDKAKWIEDARALKHACGEFGMDPINEERQRVVEYMEQHQGVAPYTYKDLGSLVGSVGGLAARKRLAPKSNGNGNGNGLDELTRTGLDYLTNNGPRGKLTIKILADLRGKYGDAWLVEHGVTWASKVLPGNGQVTPIMP
jgi:hypothetical protein